MASYLVQSFASGELSPKLYGRIDLPFYRTGCRTMTNMFPLPSGGAQKRPGTYYAATGKTSGRKVRLIPWVKSPTEGLVLEFGHQYIRYYKDGAQIETGGSPVETTTTYDEDDLFELRYAQIGNDMYIVHPSYVIRKLTRTSDTSWSIADVTITAGAGEEDFNAAGDYPSQVEIYEDRLILAATDNNPGTFWGSQVATYENFTLGTNATDAWEKTPQAKQNNKILWLLAEQALLFGASSGAWRVGGKETLLNPNASWWPTKQSAVGSDNVQALMVDDIAVFVQKGGKRIRQFQYSEPVDKYLAMDITALSDHITGDGVVEIAYQREPLSILWAVRDDGDVATMTYDRQLQTYGWSTHDFGGDVESLTIIPTATEDQVWLSVKRTVDGSTVRHIEYLAPHEFEAIENCHFVDAGVQVDNGAAATITSITAAEPPVVTATAHGFSNDDKVRLKDVSGMDEVNGEAYTVKNKTTDTFELYTLDGTAEVDGSTWTAGTGGTAEVVSSTITGLTHLEGEEVAILADGSVLANETVASGSVSADQNANELHAGLPFTATLQPMDVAEAQNKKKRITELFFKVYRSYGAKIGSTTDNLYEVAFQTGAPTMDAVPVLVSDNLTKKFPGGWEYRGTVIMQSDKPQPLTVLSMIYEVDVNESR